MTQNWSESLCQTCGACCFVGHGVAVHNLEEISERTGMREEHLFQVEAIEQLPGQRFPVINTRAHGRCVFLERKDGQHSCTIHEFKPDTCRTYKCWLLGSVTEFLQLDGQVLRSNPFYGVPAEELEARAKALIPAVKASLLWDWWWSGNTDAVTPLSVASLNATNDFPALV
jgi:hypothetical protein